MSVTKRQNSRLKADASKQLQTLKAKSNWIEGTHGESISDKINFKEILLFLFHSVAEVAGT